MNQKRMLFEVSWEVCNMVGGIHTVLATKVPKMQEIYGDGYILIGPDTGRHHSLAGVFREENWHAEMNKNLSSLPIGVRMGRWLIPGEPRVLLLQFDAIFERKDRILGEYWERYGLNSLTGGHDYLEPVMFAHAAGMLIERIFCSHLLHRGVETVVQAHEWLGAAAMLYLKEKCPEIGTVFTTHATSLGRTLCSHRWDQDLSSPESFQPEYLAQQYGVVAKHSIESVSARIADCFTTVSSITADECEVFFRRRPEVLLLNGLGENVPDPKCMDPDLVGAARERLLGLARLTTGHSYQAEKTTLMVSAGRYEFHNKGVDVTLDALARLNEELREAARETGSRVISFLMFPADHTGPRPKLLAAYKEGQATATGEHYFSTHGLREEAHDPILNRLAPRGLRNGRDCGVHVIFVPIYLNGQDPLIPEPYYRLLAAADLGIFPSFYEPWGYTPAESIGLGVPTITSDLAGFGIWARDFGGFDETGVHVLKRRGRSPEQAVEELHRALGEFLRRAPEQRRGLARAALATSQRCRWGEFGEAYRKAHELALAAARSRTSATGYDRFRAFSACQLLPPVTGEAAPAHIRHFVVANKLPPALERLKELVRENLWWSWNPEVQGLLEELDPELWARCQRNPLTFIDRLRPETLQGAGRSKTFLERAEILVSRFRHYMEAKKEPEVAYFCMEFGISHVLKLYSGGLGILAGDHLKTASDMAIPLCAFGLAYRFGYFRQRITTDGAQEHLYEPNDFHSLPMSPVNDRDGKQVRFTIESPTGPIWLRAWKAAVGRVDLYLLDADFSENSPQDRHITDRLYGGDQNHRLRQEYVLAVGGYELMRILGLRPKVFHMNEGHTAFLVLSRIGGLMTDQGIGFAEALEFVRHTTGFTTHTPVAAGHDVFPEAMVAPYLQLFARKTGGELPRLQELGRNFDRTRENPFSMTLLAARGSAFINAVSKIHGGVSRRMFHGLLPRFHESEVPITSVTNGVHAATWVAPEWQRLFAEQLGEDWREHLSDAGYWARFREADTGQCWQAHVELKRKLLKWLRGHLRETWNRRQEHPANLATALANLNEDTFIATFARRFAPYKRASLLFRDPARLAKLLSGDVPIVFLFAGKAHPSDGLGQSLITKVIEVSRRPEFFGKILLIENYEIDVAQLLVRGSDLWINNPVRPLEASGTSGMKAAMNGCLNLSVADGWWAEAHNGGNGWVIGDESLTQAPEFQDTFDSSHMLTLLERDVLPKFREREKWVSMMRESIATIVPGFNTERMLAEYQDRFYTPAREQAPRLAEKDYAPIRDLTASRGRVLKSWNAIAFADIQLKELENERMELGQKLKLQVRVNHPGLRCEDIQVQAVLSGDLEAGADHFGAFPMTCVSDGDGAESAWEGEVELKQIGPQNMGVRVIPRPCHEVHPVDLMLDLVKWL
ncbi:MAG: alpha-glucan family phosphorylase [Oligoflexia bacterium]|nr:alpha-glucan family phosphorylase [Oligoflexia bacterium]